MYILNNVYITIYYVVVFKLLAPYNLLSLLKVATYRILKVKAKYAIVTGDPKRVEWMAGYLDRAFKVAEHREFKAYMGFYNGVPLIIASTGIGAPSTAILVETLMEYGIETFIRIGTCGALKKGIRVGGLVIPYATVRLDGTSRRYIPLEYPAVAHPEVYSLILNLQGRL